MALNFSSASIHPKPPAPPPPLSKPKHLFKLYIPSTSTSPAKAALSEGSEGGFTEEETIAYSGSLSSARTQLDLLEQLTSNTGPVDDYESDGGYGKLTIRDQLAQLVGDGDDDFSIPLGKDIKKVSPKFLTVSQKRNIKRQAYLNEVSKRNDDVFLATIAAFVLFPPLIVLVIALATGYVQFFP
ncbi:hypothetical protein RJ639_014755 [Escallonia herrerae]|uniref:Uncharacterized protein n=1 Tax=Escallonia herrerae TaxID=1293975 RepID=A0AA89AMW1_9ASTE|nr:hypothetical protein RJ639_014752 [Escallonia herrerae]KAK3008418.1 hypothetical protein RJ639_014755 [Escallonia herrerae]